MGLTAWALSRISVSSKYNSSCVNPHVWRGSRLATIHHRDPRRGVADFAGDMLTVKRSIWKAVVNEPKTRASRQSVPVIPTLAKILDEHRASMRNPGTGVIFHSGNGEHMDMDKLAQRVIRPAVEACLPWYGWHGFRRGIASNLYELGANDKIVQRVLRHAKPHVTRERYIKAFDPAVMEAMQRMQVVVNSPPAVGQQTN